MDVVVQEGDAPERRVHVAGDVAIIGRAPDCDVVVDRPYVSKQHAKLLAGSVVLDLGSSNGTFVEDEEVKAGAVLGDRWLRLGAGDVRVRVEGGVARAVEPVPAKSLRETQLAEEVETLRRELGAAEKPDPEALERLSADCRRLTEENAKLRAGLVELRSRAAMQLPSDATVAQKLLFQIQRENAALKREVIKARAQLEARPATAERAAPDFASLTALLQDVDAVPAPFDAALDEFLLVESFRFLRRVERLVSRLAGGLVQIFQMETTIVPGAEGNTRELVGELLRGDDDRERRERLLAYLREIGRWFVVALGAQKAAAQRFATELRNELTEEALLGDTPVSLLKRKETELWRLATEHLAELTDEVVEERLEALARRTSLELLDIDGGDAFGGHPRA